jgi:hypothetical protein
MKKLIAALLFVATSVFGSNQAEARSKYLYTGTQIQTNLHFKGELVPEKLDLKLSGVYLTVPDAKVHNGFVYAGVEIPVGEHFWVGPRFGVAINWGGQFPTILSLSMGASLFKGKLALFAIGEGLLSEEIQDYFGYYEAGIKLTPWISFGVQAEQVNKSVIFGPHLYFHYKTLTVGMQYYFGFQKACEGHAVRIFFDFMIPES